MRSYKLTSHAETDIEEIIRYTITEWGERQAKEYVDRLHQCFQNIAEKHVTAKTFSKRFPDVLVTRCQHHYIFYLHSKQTQPRILAVLHERMDLLTRLKNRLN